MTREEADLLPVQLPTVAEQDEWDRFCYAIVGWDAELRERGYAELSKASFWETTKRENPPTP